MFLKLGSFVVRGLLVMTSGLLLSVSAASADTLTETFTGKVTSGVDTQGFFGSTGATLDGLDYTAKFVFETSLTSHSTQLVDGAVSASLTINGVPYLLGPGIGSIIRVEDGCCYVRFYNVVQVVPQSGQTFDIELRVIEDETGVLYPKPAGLEIPFSLSHSGFGEFIVGGEQLNLDVQSVVYEVTATPAVPEPSTWAMLILGFAGIGAMTYRRHKSAALAA